VSYGIRILALIGFIGACWQPVRSQSQDITLANGITVRASPDGRTITIAIPTQPSANDSRVSGKLVISQIYPVHQDLIRHAGQGWWEFVIGSLDGVRYQQTNQIWSGYQWALGYAQMEGASCIAYIAAGRDDKDVAETIVHEAAHCSKKGTPQYPDQNYAVSVERSSRRALDVHCRSKDYWGLTCQ
jgi:hypothetical protein